MIFDKYFQNFDLSFRFQYFKLQRCPLQLYKKNWEKHNSVSRTSVSESSLPALTTPNSLSFYFLLWRWIIPSTNQVAEVSTPFLWFSDPAIKSCLRDSSTLLSCLQGITRGNVRWIGWACPPRTPPIVTMLLLCVEVSFARTSLDFSKLRNI